MSVHLSQDLIKKYGIRNVTVKKGDKIKIISGQFKGKMGKVDFLKVSDSKVMIDGIDVVKKDGTKTKYAFHPSNLMIVDLELSDKRRLKSNKNIKSSNLSEKKLSKKDSLKNKEESKVKIENDNLENTENKKTDLNADKKELKKDDDKNNKDQLDLDEKTKEPEKKTIKQESQEDKK